MCGIYGIFGNDPARAVDSGALARMAVALAHRGPDGGGVHEDGPLGMGMRRLSIIDLATGDQPMANEDGSVWVVFNGELYNYRELTAELVARGHRFTTSSDTEVLVHLWEDHGPRLVERLRGMFGFAIWDSTTRTLMLARDRLGIKPLFYAQTPRGVVFGSELKAVLQEPSVARRIDPAALRSYLSYGYVPDPATILDTVAKLPPGHTLLVRDGRVGVPAQYWDVTPAFRVAGAPRDEASAAEALEPLLRDAVRSHLIADVPVGAFLSGGVDSTAVVALMAELTGGRVKTFSVGFEGAANSELPYARRVAEWFGTEHHELHVTPGDVGLLESLLSVLDEPFADSSAIPTYLVSRLARRHVKVVMSGDGGDEIFAGYDRYVVDHRRRHLGRLADRGHAGLLRGASRLLPDGTPGKNWLYNLSLPRLQRYVDSVTVFPARALPALLEVDSGPVADGFDAAFASCDGLDPLSQLQNLDIKTYLPGDILTKVDRMTMATSIEARPPLLDHLLVEFACALPPELRLGGGVTKRVLRRVLRGRVPEEVLTRPKQGFDPPLVTWLAGGLSGFFEDELGDGRTLSAAGLRGAEVQRLQALHRATLRPDLCRRLWALVVLNRSLRRLAEPVTATDLALAETA
ncbi:MAG TPA: asparagine synthase (glutamine-hydrolyzing) [Methylomirabilota bacterium]|jgi:asparagine synthase (glutamine-hydrolysing)|nr:asparagine synthase (glutamine-hydrolyzing) [Methylomirabilota bacterium]